MMMEEQNQVSTVEGGGGNSVKDEEIELDNRTEEEAPDEEDQEALPHSEILDIFEEGLAQLVQDPLLCDLPIQVGQMRLSASWYESEKLLIYYRYHLRIHP